MTKEKIRILHRVLAITFLVTAALALIAVLVRRIPKVGKYIIG